MDLLVFVLWIFVSRVRLALPLDATQNSRSDPYMPKLMCRCIFALDT
jgi:hypothetical protein